MIRAIITDFDGTLVDTFDANLKAYQKAFGEVGVVLSEESIVNVSVFVLIGLWK